MPTISLLLEGTLIVQHQISLDTIIITKDGMNREMRNTFYVLQKLARWKYLDIGMPVDHTKIQKILM